ncbi:hypothetical protein [Paenibacillus pini]|uniref:Uncharacterized protein n=1 Tax=Paenibacillus pini JCM 16418 TaxID=1236976 RepID=W7Z1M6_9BACL|nr:hypothetical protein [Paenibacillus pini]GAF10891.1 hypothetical protein JCM16418_5123 [Paenibacillus pini JCM 16418]
MNQLLFDIVFVLILYLVIGILWMIAEKIIYGHIMPRAIDNVIALILALLIFVILK